MTDNNQPKKRTTAHLQLLLIFAVFAVPLMLAVWLYYGGGLQAQRTGSNQGVLLQPIVNLYDELDQSELRNSATDQWVMLYANDSVCADPCRVALYRLRQTRLMLGKDMDRVVRVFLHGDSAPDTVFLEEQHPGLITMTDNRLDALLAEKRPEDVSPGGSYLIDPLGNLVMYFPPDLNPRALVDDVKHLLKLSHIG